MTLHLIKLCVGADTVEDLAAWIDFRRDEALARSQKPEQKHTTRMIPKRADEILSGGSLYWVIKGVVQVRQRVIAIRPFTDAQGIKRCDLVLDPGLVRTAGQPRRPFQGWRYLKPEDAPRDLPAGAIGADDDEMPAKMRRELAELALL